MCAEVGRARPTCSSDPVARVRSPPILHGVDRIRVVLAEDNYLVREGVRRLVEAQAELELLAVCEDLDSLLAAVDEHAPDVVLSQYDEPSYAITLLERGSSGRAYLLKERVSDVDQLLAAIREVKRGGSVIDPKVVEGLVNARARAKESPLARLTPREKEIMAEMAQGKNNAAIAATLSLSERAVEKHINSIFSKLGLSQETDAHRRVKAVLLFLSDQGG